MKKAVFFWMCAGIFLHTYAYAQNLAVVVNEQSPLLDESKASLEIKEVKDIYLGKLKFSKGMTIKAVNQKDKEMLSKFLKKACVMNIAEYQNHWVKLELEMGISPPKIMESSKDILHYIQNEKAGIGYVLEDEAKDVAGIKVVLVLPE